MRAVPAFTPPHSGPVHPTLATIWMLTLLLVLSLGFALGVRHAADPDHVIAVSTIVSGSDRFSRAAWVGALWGVGHTATILLVGGAIIIFRLTIPPRLGLSMELAVAAMLIFLGVRNLMNPARPADDRTTSFRPLIVGFVHGLAGSAAVALLVLTTIDDARWSFAYLLIFGAGTVAGMVLITAAVAVPLRLGAMRFAGINRHLRVATGALSLIFGLFLVHQIGFQDGLFLSGVPDWDPH